MMNDLKRKKKGGSRKRKKGSKKKKKGVAPVKAINHLKIYPCTQISHDIGVRLGTRLICDRKSAVTACILVKL